MFSRKSPKAQNRIDSLVGAGTTIEGDITFSGGLRIDGQIKGNVRAAGDQSSMLVVSEQARIEGEVTVSHVVINGTIIGPVHSSEFLELQPKARVTGDVEYNTIEMHLGSIIQGRLVHQGTQVKAVELKLASSGN
jgi:cytoskeletal protein CcmA (bactofilin family)